MKKKVLHVINSMTIGGAEILLANSLSPGGLNEYTENYLAYFKGGSYLLDSIDKGVKIIDLDYKGGTDIIRLLRQLRRVIKDNKIDLVHTHLTPASVYTHLVCPATVAQVHTIHTTYSMDTETSRVMSSIERQLYFTKKNCNIICLSDFTKEDFLKTIPFKGRVFVLNNFVPDVFFDIQANKQQLPRQELKLIAMGTLKPLKNFEYLLKVFGDLKNYNISLDIFGGGSKDHYEKEIKESQLNIRMMGHSGNLKELLKDYDLFIMPSRFEGFPLSVFEAMAAGIPLILSDIPPLRSIVKNNAIYFELDNPAAAGQQLVAILKNEIDIDNMAIRAKEYAEKTVRREIYINKLLEIYEQVLR